MKQIDDIVKNCTCQEDMITLQHYRRLIEAAGDIIYLIDRDGYFTYVNPRAYTLLGYTPEEVIGKRFTTFVSEDWKDRVQAFYANQLQNQVSETTLEFPVVTKNGQEFWAEQTVVSIVENGVTTGFQGNVRDITKRKRAENELSLRLEQLTVLQRVDIELMDALDIDYILTMALDQIVRLSHADSGFIGLAQRNDQMAIAQAIGDYSGAEPIPYCDPQAGIVGRVIQEHRPEFVLDIEAAGCHSVIPDIRAQMAIPLLSRNGLIGVLCLETRKPERFTMAVHEFAQLITTRVAAAITNAQLYTAVQQQLTELHELYTLKSRFVSMVSHEFRTPLATILSASNNLHDYFERMTVEQRAKQVSKVRTQIDHMTNLLDDVLTIGRTEAGIIQFNPTLMDLHAFCLRIVEQFRSLHRTNQIIYNCTGHPEEILFDEKLMRQVITNLLSNAIKYSPADRPVTLNLKFEERQIELSIRDEGMGIPESDYQQLFQPFHRASNVGTIAGTGLGLAITKHAAELHGGQITFSSKVGEGTTFTVTIPQEKDDQSHEENSRN
ncbi:MAG: PAS domain S-box protein [Anaerolineae bacterium]|nr:PAS domain S-box protein [Anaerolineae bacterium]